MYTCKTCKKQYSRRGYLNHLNSNKCNKSNEQLFDFWKEEFDSLGLDAEFIKYNNGIFYYRCNKSNMQVSSRVDRISSSRICKCHKCQFEHKSKVSKNHWLNDDGSHAKAISNALLHNQKHKERSSLLCVQNNVNQRGHQPWSKYEQEISDYLTMKNIEHQCNSVVLHLDGTTKNFIYDIYIPKYNMLMELNDRHFTDHLYTREELESIKKFKTYYNDALNAITKQELAESKGYSCYTFYNLNDCKKFIDSLVN